VRPLVVAAVAAAAIAYTSLIASCSTRLLFSVEPARGKASRLAFALGFGSSASNSGSSLDAARFARQKVGQLLDRAARVARHAEVQEKPRQTYSEFKKSMEDFVGQADMAWAEPDQDLDDSAPAEFRDVKVFDQRELNELLKLANPLRPTSEMQLVQVTLDDGTVIDRPKKRDLMKLKVSKYRPCIFKWKDRSQIQTGAPRDYDEFIQKLLNASPSDMEDLVRANWKKFDQAFFFRILDLREETTDPRLKEKLELLEKFCGNLLEAAVDQRRRTLPEQYKDAQEIMKSMLEGDGDTLLWPLPGDSYLRLAEAVTLRAVRAKYADGWFENVIEAIERFGVKAEAKGEEAYLGISKVALQRLVTEWLRHDDLWEETAEGKFLFRLMAISREQWIEQLTLEADPVDSYKMKEELKIISETKVIKLPMASKLQIYASKYLKELLEFVEKKDEIIAQLNTGEAAAQPN